MNSGIMEIDVHGMNQFQAKTTINAALKKATRGTYIIRIIHGYHNGQVFQFLIILKKSQRFLMVLIMSKGLLII